MTFSAMASATYALTFGARPPLTALFAAFTNIDGKLTAIFSLGVIPIIILLVAVVDKSQALKRVLSGQ